MGTKTHVSAGLRRILQVRWSESRQGHASPNTEVHFVKALLGDARFAPGVVVSAHAERGNEVEVNCAFDFADILAPGMPLTLEAGVGIKRQASDAAILTLTRFPPEIESFQVENPISLSCMGGDHFEFSGRLTFEGGFSAKVAVGFSAKDGGASPDYTRFAKPNESPDGVLNVAKLKLEAKALAKASAGVEYVAVTCRDRSPLCYPNVADPLISTHIENLLGKDKTELKNIAIDVFKMPELTPEGKALLPSELKDRFKSLVSGTLFEGMGRLVGNVRKDMLVSALEALEKGLDPPTAGNASRSAPRVRYCNAGTEDRVRRAITAAQAGLTAFYGFSQTSAKADASAALVSRGQQGATDWDAANELRNNRMGYSFLSICGMKGFASVGVEAGVELAGVLAHAQATGSIGAAGHINRTSYRYQALTYNTSTAKSANGVHGDLARFGVVTQDTVVYYTSAKVVKEVEVSAQFLNSQSTPEAVERRQRELNRDKSVTEKGVVVGGREYELRREYGRLNTMRYHSAVVYWVPPPAPQPGVTTTMIAPQKGSGLSWGRSFEIDTIATASGAFPASAVVRDGAIDQIAEALEMPRDEVAAFVEDAKETVAELLQQSQHGRPQCSALLIEVAATCDQLPEIEARVETVDGRRTWVLPPVTTLSNDSFFDAMKARQRTLTVQSFRLRVRQTDLVTNDALLFRASFCLGADQDIEGKNSLVLRSVDRMGADAVIDLFTYHPRQLPVLALQAPTSGRAAPAPSPRQNRFVERFRGSLNRSLGATILRNYGKTLGTDATAKQQGDAFLKGVIPGWENATDPHEVIAQKVGPMVGRPLTGMDVFFAVDVAQLLLEVVAPDPKDLSSQVLALTARMHAWSMIRTYAEFEALYLDDLMGDQAATARLQTCLADLARLTGNRVNFQERRIEGLKAAVLEKGLKLRADELTGRNSAAEYMRLHEAARKRDEEEVFEKSVAIMTAAKDRMQLHTAAAKEGPVPKCPVPPVALFYR